MVWVGVAGGVVGVEVVVGVVDVVVDVVVVEVEVVDVVVEVEDVEVVVELWQSRRASCEAVETPSARSRRRVGLTVTGRLTTELPSACALVAAVAQFRVDTADESWSRLPCKSPA